MAVKKKEDDKHEKHVYYRYVGAGTYYPGVHEGHYKRNTCPKH